MEYLPLEAAAMFINPQYKQRSIHAAMKKHVESGNFKEYFPDIAIIDEDKNILQVIGESEKPYFKVSELKQYKETGKKLNMKNGNQRKVNAKGNGIDRTFGSIQAAAEILGVDYYKLYNSLDRDKAINGYIFTRV